MPGPVPKRSDQRRRRNTENGEITHVPTAGEVVRSPADGAWHPIAIEWYESLARSGQAQYYESSDWAVARYVAEAMSRSLAGQKMSGQMFAAVMSAMNELLTTEGARRRARMEIERDTGPVEDPKVTAINEYRKRLEAK